MRCAMNRKVLTRRRAARMELGGRGVRNPLSTAPTATLMRWAFVLAVGGPLGSIGCSAGSEGAQCTVDSDCAPGLVCEVASGTCARVTCAGDANTCSVESAANSGTSDTEDGAARRAADAASPTADATEAPGGTDAAAAQVDGGGTAVDGDVAQRDTNPAALQVWRVDTLRVGTDGVPGEGLDVDANPSTCAPACPGKQSSCNGGVDNALAGLADLANSYVQDALDSGAVSLALVFDPTPPGSLSLVQVQPVGEGRVRLSPSTELSGATPATRNDQGRLVAGPGGQFVVPLPLDILGGTLEVTVHDALADGNTQADHIVVVLGGVVIPEELDASLCELKPEACDSMKAVVGNLICLDLDRDADGTPDAYSAGIVVEGTRVEFAR